ncbi:hypothetical protein EVA_10675 [gut metagenome]|uniref:Uncharacterized protein n=1 Tax=gut metagenome TaxID=749906 RepID=J9GH86_9ZZZZ
MGYNLMLYLIIINDWLDVDMLGNFAFGSYEKSVIHWK